MNEQEARLILQAYRPGADPDDPEVAAALQEAARNPELARWFAEEQAFDRAIAAHLGNVPAPFGLKTRILAQLGPPAAPHRWSWAVKLAGVAALLFLLTQVVSLFRPAAPEAQVSNYAREMVSFVRLGGALDMESQRSRTNQRMALEKGSVAGVCATAPGCFAAVGLPAPLLSRSNGHADLLQAGQRQARASFRGRSGGPAADEVRCPASLRWCR